MQQKNKESKFVKEGVVAITRSGAGFFMHEDLDNDIRIEKEYLNTALNGDVVELLMLPKRPGDRQQHGKVLKVIERARTKFVGTILKKGDEWILKPDNKRVYKDFVLEDVPKNTNVKHKALLELTYWEDSTKAPKGKILKILGRTGENETEMQAILLERGFVSGFPNEVENEARNLLKERIVKNDEMEWRKDFRDATTFTIDPHDAKDFDDALSIRTLENGNYEVGIHIADVTHFVRSGSVIDTEAQNRATSVYLVDRTIPMLPEVISNDLCSLNPNEEKRAFSVIFEINKNAEIINHYFAKTLIKSNFRFTYKTAQFVLDGKSKTYYAELNILWSLSKKLREKRVDAGAIEFDSKEIAFQLDKNGKPTKAFVKESLNTMKLIEEFMLLTNRVVAKFISEKCKDGNPSNSVCIYRIHETPDANKLAELSVFLRALGYNHLNKDANQIKAKDIAQLLKDIKGTPEEEVIQTATLRSMAKAIYSSKNIGHFSLSFSHYTHFTSPIRRYPDIMVHRILHAHINNTSISKEEIDSYKSLALRSSQREVEAVRAERDSIKLKQVEYMNSQVGNIFDGKVTGVTKGGMFVSENNTLAEGLVRMNAIPGGWFELDEMHYALVDKKSGKQYRIGDKVKIKLKKADLESRELDWEII